MTTGRLACTQYAAGRCRSCTWIERSYDDQLADKQRLVADLLGGHVAAWEPPYASAPAAFRNKAKMVVGGTFEQPTLGILGSDGQGVDLRDCALHEPAIVAALPILAEFVSRIGLRPYEVAGSQPVNQRGELKHILVTCSPDGELMVRLVVRSTADESRVRKHLAWLDQQLPGLRVLTLNVQPIHRAVIEGDREIVLSAADSLPMRLGAVTLHLRPRSFFQTNTAVAEALYSTARTWAAECPVATVVDLYCGVGGFALHLAAPGRSVIGLEISADAVASAERSAAEAGLADAVRFVAGDATAPDRSDVLANADLVVVNPPRRGLGEALAGRLDRSGAAWLLYSSCNPNTLVRDLAVMGGYRVERARLFDMFPQTEHAEVLVLLRRVD